MNRTFPLLVFLVWATTITAGENPPSPAQQYLHFALTACDRAEKNIPELTRVAEIVADRHIQGGQIGFGYSYQRGHGLDNELWGRSGQIIHMGFERPWKLERTDAEKAQDILITGWTRAPEPGNLEFLKGFKQKKGFIIGFGPRDLPALSEHVKVCDAWFDTGYGSDDRAVQLSDGSRVGHGNLLRQTIDAWALMGEIISACTRQGKMPVIGKSFSYADGIEWWNRYYQKKQFHDDFEIAPVKSGVVGGLYIGKIRELIRKYERTQLPNVQKTANLIAKEIAAGRKVALPTRGHLAWAFAGREEGSVWAMKPVDVAGEDPPSVVPYLEQTPDHALALHISDGGQRQEDQEYLRQKQQRVMLITAENPRPEYQLPDDLLNVIDMGWEHGDAAVSIPGYPIRALPPSGVMQLIAYETVNVEVLARLATGKVGMIK